MIDLVSLNSRFSFSPAIHRQQRTARGAADERRRGCHATRVSGCSAPKRRSRSARGALVERDRFTQAPPPPGKAPARLWREIRGVGVLDNQQALPDR